MYYLNEDILFRIEFFGGVLINKRNFTRYELNKSQAIFVKAIELVGDLEQAKNIHDFFLKEKEYDIDRFLSLGIIQNKDSSNYKEKLSSIDAINEIKRITDEIFELNFLSAPLEITIYPTLNCNLNCKFCFLKNKKSNEISSKKWLEIIKQAKDMGVLSISILGGEPSIYSEIDDLLLGIEKIGINTTITTNGSKLKDSTKRILSESKFIVPVISLQSLNEKNMYLMGKDYKETLNTIKYFLKNKKNIRLNSVYTNQSVEEILEVLDYVVNNNIERYSIASYVNSNDKNFGLKKRTLKDSRNLEEKIDKYIQEKYTNKEINWSIEGCLLYSAYPEIMNEINELSEFNKLYYGCRAAKSKMEIYANGDVYPCICFEDLIDITSNILSSNLKSIWINDLNLNKLRNDRATSKECLECGFNNFCNGGCPALKRKVYSDQYNKFKDPNCCIDNIKDRK